MQEKEKITIFWFRRDLRLEDNHALHMAQQSGFPVLPIFIFDDNITAELEKNDARINFIYDRLESLNKTISKVSSTIYCKQGDPIEIWKNIISEFNIHAVYTNEDYEPYAIKRDKQIKEILNTHGIELYLLKDQVIFDKKDILKPDGTPYTIYTPYKKKWLQNFSPDLLNDYHVELNMLYKFKHPFPSKSDLGFRVSDIKVLDYNLNHLDDYEKNRDYPAFNKTSYLSPHLRFGTVSIRRLINKTLSNSTFIDELIWREFFMQILYNFPHVVENNFKSKYDNVTWRNNEDEFEKWKTGKTGYPMVDAGMRELNATGYMHNRVRMITSGFLCKHLLIDWRWGEAYFATKLLDFELAANNGNWQWAAGTGCDAAPYFRIFNPTEQIKKFDSELLYIKKWVPELETFEYPAPIVEHKMARARALETYKSSFNS